MIFANLHQRCEQARRQMATLLLILLSFGVLSACNVQAVRQVGQEPSDESGKVISLKPKQTHSNQRVALVIGNGAYHKAPLPNPPNDSDDMATVLEQIGFEVMVLKDGSLKKMKKAIQQFGEKLGKGGVGLFYFAGHGVQYQGENYLFPIGAMRSVTVAEHLPYETLRVGYLLATMEGARNNLNVVILDACRNNPFARSLFVGRGVNNPDGLALMEVPSGSLIAYATRPNKTALDGTGRNSPYVKHLKRELPKPGLSIVEVLTNVRVAVKKETKNSQEPGFYSELDRKFCFVGPCGQNTPSQPVAAPVSAPMPVLKSDRDSDDVADSLDKCPDNTSAEISAGVDSRGCPLDKDQDGVADYRDSCLGTSAGIKVKENGCPAQSSTSGLFDLRLKNDGVANYAGRCLGKKSQEISHSIAVISTSRTKYSSSIESLVKNYDDVVVTDYEKWATYKKTYPFNRRMIIDLGSLSFLEDHINKKHMTLNWWYRHYGYIKLDFKDDFDNVIHKFYFDKSGGHHSAFLSFDGQVHNTSTATNQNEIYGFIVIENNKLKYLGENGRRSYTANDGTYKSYTCGLESKHWTMSKFDKVSKVELSIGTIGRTASDGVSQIPLVISTEVCPTE